MAFVTVQAIIVRHNINSSNIKDAINKLKRGKIMDMMA